MTNKNYSYQIKNKFSELKDIKTITGQLKKDHALSDKILFQIRLALEEFLVNIMMYGYENYGKESISLTIDVNSEQAVFQINSGGTPFNPLSFKNKDKSTRLEEKKEGGAGISLALSFMDKADYEYKNGLNHLTLTKNINGTSR